MKTLPLALKVEVVSNRELLPQERRQIENRLRFAIERTTPFSRVVFSDLIDEAMLEDPALHPAG